ncbi:DUF1361 domain-containing protein [Paenibacillus sp. GCM10027627]|uniref:DUF1361 domain-containing protein n=1 Tax=unclassified Paenibacillus TaxID=185978 RepID=UPI00363BC695
MNLSGLLSERNKARLLFGAYALTILIFQNNYFFMVFNLFLAFAALEISYLLPLFRSKSKIELPAQLLVYLVFLLMSPNVFYMVTDLIHLNAFRFKYWNGLYLKEWLNFTLLVSGVMIAVYYYSLMIKGLKRLLSGSKWGLPILLLFIVLGSVGIYIGRFLRFHSVHLFTEPFSLIEQFFASLSKDALLFIGFITVLQLLVIWMFASREKEV